MHEYFFMKIICDFKVNSFISFLTLFLYRIENLSWRRMKVLHPLIHIVVCILKRILGVRSQISYKCQVGNNLRLPHKADGVVISKYAVIGNNVTIFHHVTLGINENKSESERKIVIGDECYISTGVKIISCKLGCNVKVAPNVVVYKNCKNNDVVL